MAAAQHELNFSQPVGKKQSLFGSLAFMGSWLWQVKLRTTLFTRLHSFNWITPHVILGSTAIAAEGDEQKILNACQAQEKELGLAIAVAEYHDMLGSWCTPGLKPVQWDKLSSLIPWLQFPPSIIENAKNVGAANLFADATSPEYQQLVYVLIQIAHSIAQGKVIYIHDVSGIANSWLLSMATLMGVYKMSFVEAELLLKLARPQVNPDNTLRAIAQGAEQLLLNLDVNLGALPADPDIDVNNNDYTALVAKNANPLDNVFIDDIEATIDTLELEDSEKKELEPITDILTTIKNFPSHSYWGTLFLFGTLTQKTMPELIEDAVPSRRYGESLSSEAVAIATAITAINGTIQAYFQALYPEIANSVKPKKGANHSKDDASHSHDNPRHPWATFTGWASDPRRSRTEALQRGARTASNFAPLIALFAVMVTLISLGTLPGMESLPHLDPFIEGMGIFSGEVLSSLVIGAAALVAGFLLCWIFTTNHHLSRQQKAIQSALNASDEDDIPVHVSLNISLAWKLSMLGFMVTTLTWLTLSGGFGLKPITHPFIPDISNFNGEVIFSGELLSSLVIGAAALATIILVLGLIIIVRDCINAPAPQDNDTATTTTPTPQATEEESEDNNLPKIVLPKIVGDGFTDPLGSAPPPSTDAPPVDEIEDLSDPNDLNDPLAGSPHGGGTEATLNN